MKAMAFFFVIILNMDSVITKRLHFTYHIIACTVRGNPYTADDKTKALAKAIRKYLLDVLNLQNKGQWLSDPVYASQAFHFFNHQLAWNARQWEKSAEIVYRYFKAKVLIEKIKDYQKMFKDVEMVSNYLELLNYLYESICGGEPINYSGAPGLTPDFALMPTDILDETLQKFKELYE